MGFQWLLLRDQGVSTACSHSFCNVFEVAVYLGNPRKCFPRAPQRVGDHAVCFVLGVSAACLVVGVSEYRHKASLVSPQLSLWSRYRVPHNPAICLSSQGVRGGVTTSFLTSQFKYSRSLYSNFVFESSQLVQEDPVVLQGFCCFNGVSAAHFR